MNPNSKGKGKDISRASYDKETTEREHAENEKHIKGKQRSWMNAPVDPNSPTTNINFPPGIEPEDAVDPGRATPGAPPTDNRSGKKE